MLETPVPASTPSTPLILGDGRCVLHLGDCRAIQPPPFDALLGDPPYGLGYVSRHREGRHNSPTARYIHGKSFAPIQGDDEPFDPAPWVTLAGKRPCVLWGANYYADRLPAGSHWMIWDKREGVRPNDQADCEMAWSNLKGGPRLMSHLWIGMFRRGEENLSKGGRKLHPNQKPVALMDWMLDQCGIEAGQTVFDPWMGSGSLGVACVRRGIHYVGCEIDPTYFQVAADRLAPEIDRVCLEGPRAVAKAWDSGQGTLFGSAP
jgi:DNA modification methylase